MTHIRALGDLPASCFDNKNMQIDFSITNFSKWAWTKHAISSYWFESFLLFVINECVVDMTLIYHITNRQRDKYRNFFRFFAKYENVAQICFRRRNFDYVIYCRINIIIKLNPLSVVHSMFAEASSLDGNCSRSLPSTSSSNSDLEKQNVLKPGVHH